MSKRPLAQLPSRPPGILVGWLVAACLATGLTWLFWWPLWQGGGLIGGDLYPYFLPQKVFLADSLHSGTIPLWNPLVGFGYPVLGESQTGALYPPNLVLYSLLNVNTAYNASQLAHYVVTFLAAFALARRLGLGVSGGLLSSVTFTYCWFPARICLEWAIVGGAWFVLMLWAATAFLQTRRPRYLVWMALFLGLDLLAGHYNLAFITLLALLPMPWLVREGEAPAEPRKADDMAQTATWWKVVGIGLAIVCGFLIAAVQLIPTWELKSLSQRQHVSEVFSPTYGHLPPAAISQLVIPWSWYKNERSTDELLQHSGWLAVSPATNQVEAQLYLGLLPLALAVFGLTVPALRRRLPVERPWAWGIVVILSLFFATGWPTYWLSDWPGFGFFRGPGRYSIVAAWGLALLGGAGLDALLSWRNWDRSTSAICTLLVITITVGDLWAASRKFDLTPSEYFGRSVFYVTLLDHPPVARLDQSPLREFFQSTGGNVRLFAPGQNIPTMLGVSALPVYLGLGPEVYESPEMHVDFSLTDPEQISAAASRLRAWGVTHLLLERTLNPKIWPVQPIGPVTDPFLNSALARPEPYSLYELTGSRGRAFFAEEKKSNRVLSVQTTPQQVRIEVEQASPGKLVLRDLWYPGWSLSDSSLKAERVEEYFRAVELPHDGQATQRRTIEWRYRPASIRWGLLVSVVGLVGTALLPMLFRKRRVDAP